MQGLQFAFMDPFVVTSLDQFLPGKPRSLNTDTWVSDYNEVKQIASTTSTTRTADQTSIGLVLGGRGLGPLERGRARARGRQSLQP